MPAALQCSVAVRLLGASSYSPHAKLDFCHAQYATVSRKRVTSASNECGKGGTRRCAQYPCMSSDRCQLQLQLLAAIEQRKLT